MIPREPHSWEPKFMKSSKTHKVRGGQSDVYRNSGQVSRSPWHRSTEPDDDDDNDLHFQCLLHSHVSYKRTKISPVAWLPDLLPRDFQPWPLSSISRKVVHAIRTRLNARSKLNYRTSHYMGICSHNIVPFFFFISARLRRAIFTF